MEGTMRRISSCAEYFDTLPERFIPGEAAGVDATFVYQLEGNGGGTWTVVVKDGQVAAKPGAVPDPTVTYTIKAENYIKLVNGELNGAMAFMTRKLKVAGSITMAQKMNKFLPPLEK
jgi:putative sterol carrier protein